MARFPFETNLTDQYGRIIVGGIVTVNLTGTSNAATIYAAESGGSAITDSQITTGSDGSYKFWVDTADYSQTQRFRLVLNGGDPFVTRTIDDVVIILSIEVTAASTTTFTNKTIDADTNTLSNLEHGAEVDNLSSGTHGVTGSVVGTTDTQTLSAKTLTTPTVGDLSNMAHDHADAAGGGATLTSPTIVTPTIASFANAEHDHADASGGGNLGQTQATDLTITGSAASTPDANTLTKDHTIGAICILDGTGTPAYTREINFSGSITDNGTGDYTLTIDRDFVAATYGVLVVGGLNVNGHYGTIAVGSIQILLADAAGQPVNDDVVSVVLIGPQ